MIYLVSVSLCALSRTYRPYECSADTTRERMAHAVEPQHPNEWLSRVLEAAQAAAEDTGSTACEIIAYLGAVPPAHLRPAGAPATPMLSAATPSTHVARSPRSSLLAERVARLKQSVQPHSSRTPHIGAPRPSITPTTRENELAPSGSEGSAPPVDSLFESARHRYHAQLAEATMQHNQARPTVSLTRTRTRTRTRTLTTRRVPHLIWRGRNPAPVSTSSDAG